MFQEVHKGLDFSLKQPELATYLPEITPHILDENARPWKIFYRSELVYTERRINNILKVVSPELKELITLAPKKHVLTRRASEGSASEPSLARRVSMC